MTSKDPGVRAIEWSIGFRPGQTSNIFSLINYEYQKSQKVAKIFRQTFFKANKLCHITMQFSALFPLITRGWDPKQSSWRRGFFFLAGLRVDPRRFSAQQNDLSRVVDPDGKRDQRPSRPVHGA